MPPFGDAIICIFIPSYLPSVVSAVEPLSEVLFCPSHAGESAQAGRCGTENPVSLSVGFTPGFSQHRGCLVRAHSHWAGELLQGLPFWLQRLSRTEQCHRTGEAILFSYVSFQHNRSKMEGFSFRTKMMQSRGSIFSKRCRSWRWGLSSPGEVDEAKIVPSGSHSRDCAFQATCCRLTSKTTSSPSYHLATFVWQRQGKLDSFSPKCLCSLGPF